ncbi:probable prolyl 4-hydroxylase 7 isoform X1 [Triticum dicoccoides]|uniref:probable prolyl 4-hydroxylase 7 isoform X1 n=1 Tax=Triticum dicoccoides TaxID=85692 RepID=UPI00188F024E|nr:probable prolyl 4-hydroxylase 7 isoform X1 [Triticum dicoccoides]
MAGAAARASPPTPRQWRSHDPTTVAPVMPPLLLLLLAALALALAPALPHAAAGGGARFYDPARVTQISWRPRAFLYSGFLSHAECDHLIKLAKGRLEKSMVADNESGKSVMSQVRTSSGTFLSKREDEIISGIGKCVAAWTFLPEENAESMQVLHYEVGQKYDAHFNYFSDKKNVKRGGHRVATVLMYLTDVKKGGETVFPVAEGRDLQHKDETWSECARHGLAESKGRELKSDSAPYLTAASPTPS